jgi:hypothetical protein
MHLSLREPGNVEQLLHHLCEMLRSRDKRASESSARLLRDPHRATASPGTRYQMVRPRWWGGTKWGQRRANRNFA